MRIDAVSIPARVIMYTCTLARYALCARTKRIVSLKTQRYKTALKTRGTLKPPTKEMAMSKKVKSFLSPEIVIGVALLYIVLILASSAIVHADEPTEWQLDRFDLVSPVEGSDNFESTLEWEPPLPALPTYPTEKDCLIDSGAIGAMIAQMLVDEEQNSLLVSFLGWGRQEVVVWKVTPVCVQV